MINRDLVQARRLELALVKLRWIVVAFGAVQLVLALVGQISLSGPATPLGLALLAGLALGNLAVSRAAAHSADIRQLGVVGTAAFALDIAVVLGLIWASSSTPTTPVWVLGFLLTLEGAARYGLWGALAAAALFTVSEILREVWLTDRFVRYGFAPDALVLRTGMAVVVAVVAGGFASSLQRETERATVRAAQAERSAEVAAESAASEEEARSEVTAFHSTVLAGLAQDDLYRAIQTMAEALGRELNCGSLGIVLVETDSSGEPALVAAGVFGHPGYVAGERLSMTHDPVGTALIQGRPFLRNEPISEAVAPLRVREQALGAIHERESAAGAIDRQRLLLLGRLADQIALVVQSARLRADQEQTVRRLRELDEMKSDFIAITSHELRTPLSSIRGFVDVLRRRDQKLPVEQREEFLGIIALQTERLIRLVEDLLVVSRIEGGKLSFEPKAVRVASLVRDVVAGLGEPAARVRTEIDPDTPQEIVVDPQRLTQVLTNLVHNALKFSPAEQAVDLEVLRPVEGTVAFRVVDHGPGIREDERGRIFERFHQSEQAQSREADGFGLGLYITKQLVQAMGGWITVESEVGSGSTFTVTIPAERNLQGPAPLSGSARSG